MPIRDATSTRRARAADAMRRRVRRHVTACCAPRRRERTTNMVQPRQREARYEVVARSPYAVNACHSAPSARYYLFAAENATAPVARYVTRRADRVLFFFTIFLSPSCPDSRRHATLKPPSASDTEGEKKQRPVAHPGPASIRREGQPQREINFHTMPHVQPMRTVQVD